LDAFGVCRPESGRFCFRALHGAAMHDALREIDPEKRVPASWRYARGIGLAELLPIRIPASKPISIRKVDATVHIDRTQAFP
jgi:hypothetical protein